MKTNINQKRINKGFTLIESMIVLFIIGVLSAVGAIGFGKVGRQKMVQQASNRIGTEISNARDYSIFGKQVNEKYPCGYGIAIKRMEPDVNNEDKKIWNVYTSGDRVNRVETMADNKTCDELIDNKEVDLGESPVDDPNNLSLKPALTNESQKYQKSGSNIIPIGPANGYGCLVVLFSAPRGKMFYCSGSGSACPPNKCVFQPFSESDLIYSDFFQISVLLTEGNNNEKGYLRVYPSGNSDFVTE